MVVAVLWVYQRQPQEATCGGGQQRCRAWEGTDSRSSVAFRWSCWSAGEVDCPKRTEFECGNEKRGRRNQQWVTIPPVFEDELYVLGFAWYGGGYRQGTYWSCADVRIEGGPLQNNYNPVFVNDQCMSNTNALYQCTKQPCMQEEQWGKPREFEDGCRPGALNRWKVHH